MQDNFNDKNSSFLNISKKTKDNFRKGKYRRILKWLCLPFVQRGMMSFEKRSRGPMDTQGPRA